MKMQKNATDTDMSWKALIIITTIVLAILLLTYIFTETFVSDKATPKTIAEETNSDYIYASETFKLIDKVYYVLFLDMSNYTNKKIYEDIIVKYETNPVYVVDLSKKVNQLIIAKESNKTPTNYEDLKIVDETLIKIQDGNTIGYIEKLSNITKELK